MNAIISILWCISNIILSSLVVNEEQGTAIGTEDKQTIFADGKQVIFI